jgi:SAM-dependent methyltransferase
MASTPLAAPPRPDEILQLGLGFWGSKTLLTAVELGVFTTLAEGALEREELRERLGLHPRAARDFFDALVSLGLLERDDGLYSNAAHTDTFLDRAKPSYVGGFLEMANARLYRFWTHLGEALRTGEPQNEARQGIDLFEELYRDPDRLRQFLDAMGGATEIVSRALAERFPWKERRSFVDVGCAKGALGVRLALTHEHLTGGGFDLPPVGPLFDENSARFGLSERMTFHPGDFFRDPLPSADVLIIGHVLHDWNLAEKRLLIQRVYEALPPGGALIAYDAMIDDDRREHTFGLLLSLNMLIETDGGFEYTPADCCRWMHEAGFASTSVERLIGPDTMVVGIKSPAAPNDVQPTERS